MSHRQSAVGNPQSAILLLGPTGAGKTPLGEYLAKHGLNGRTCVHFDFGERMRRAAAQGKASGLPAWAVTIIRVSLSTCRLLRPDEFPVALRILKLFLRKEGRSKLVILNGLPRRKSQAAGLAKILHIDAVVVLNCVERTVHERIRLNSGGDRSGRNDDVPGKVRKKLEIFRKMTIPLIDYFGMRGASIVRIRAATGAGSAEMARLLSKRIQGATWLSK